MSQGLQFNLKIMFTVFCLKFTKPLRLIKWNHRQKGLFSLIINKNFNKLLIIINAAYYFIDYGNWL